MRKQQKIKLEIPKGGNEKIKSDQEGTENAGTHEGMTVSRKKPPSARNPVILVTVTSIEVLFTIPICVATLFMGILMVLKIDESQQQLFELAAIFVGY